MNTKITLSIDEKIVVQAKNYARNNQISLSKLMENYINALTKKSEKKSKISPLVESLTGVIHSEKNDLDKNYQKYLSKKHS